MSKRELPSYSVKRKKLLLQAAVTAALVFFAGPPASAMTRVVTLDEAYRLAVDTNESVKIAGEGVSQAKSNLGKATSRILPNITADGNYTRYSERKSAGNFVVQPDESSKVDLRVTQPLYSGGREWATRRQAKFLIEKSREGLDSSKENIIIATARSYYGVLKAEKDLEIKKAALKRADERKKVAQARFRVGEVTKSAVLRAEAESAGAEAELTKAETDLVDAKTLLKRRTGVTDDDIAVVEPAARKATEKTPEELVKRAYDSRRDYRQRVLDEKVASEGIQYAWGGFKPSLKAEGLYSWKDQDPETTFFQRDSLSASLILTYPLFEGGLRRAELSEARSKFREAELRRLALKRDIEVEVRDAYNNVESIKAVMESYARQLSFAQENYNMVFEQFKFGVATTVDVIDADATLISAQRSYMSASYDLQLAILELEYNAGILFDQTVKDGSRQK